MAVVAAMQGAVQHIRSSLGFSILLKDALTSNQQPSDNKKLVGCAHEPQLPQLPNSSFR